MRLNKLLFLALGLLLLFSACEQFGVGERTDLNTSTNPEIIIESEFQTSAPVVHFADVVLDADKKALPGVAVSVYAAGLRYSEMTDVEGRYKITVPYEDLPTEGFISMSIVAENYRPRNVTYAAPLLANTTYGSQEIEILLNPCPNCLRVNGEKSAELFHLGDDGYAGVINSQFQKTTDGIELDFQLENSAEYAQLKLSFQAKGLNPPVFPVGSSVVFGTEGLEEFLWKAPEDGSFGNYEITVPNSSAINSIKVKTRNHGEVGSDYDDWEFTCLHVEGIK